MPNNAKLVRSNGFPRHVRLLTALDFARVFEDAKRLSGKYFTLVVRARNLGASERRPARLGFAVARKQIRSSPGRNRIKRCARELFRHSGADLPAFDIVLMARSVAANAPASELRAELARLLLRCAQLPTSAKS